MLAAVAPELRILAEEWERLHSDLPPVLHHYTTAPGLIGIIGSQRLWATNARFLNDPSEIRYALKMISETVAEKQELYLAALRADSKLVGAMGDSIGRVFGKAAPKIEIWAKDLLEVFNQQREVYVTSFCEKGDLLSQWRGYAAAGGGYALGIAPGEIWGTTGTRPPVILRKVIYDPEDQRQIVSQWVQRMFDDDLAWRRARADEWKNSSRIRLERQEQLHKESQEQPHEEAGGGEPEKTGLSGRATTGLSSLLGPRFGPPGTALLDSHRAQVESLKRFAAIEARVTQFLAECLVTFKDPAYYEEREWRAIQFGVDAPVQKFRTRGGNIVPYVELDLRAAESSAPGRLPITTITYGPTLEPGVSDRALKMLCASAGYSEVTVRQSSIPYRGPG